MMITINSIQLDRWNYFYALEFLAEFMIQVRETACTKDAYEIWCHDVQWQSYAALCCNGVTEYWRWMYEIWKLQRVWSNLPNFFFGTNRNKLRQKGRKSYLSSHSNRPYFEYRCVTSSIYIYLLMIYLTTFAVAQSIHSLRCCVSHWIMNGKVWVWQRSRSTLKLSLFIGNITKKRVRVNPHVILHVFHTVDINK